MHRVLLLEDDVNIVELLTIHLNDLGCEVVAVMNGQKGLSTAMEQSFDLIILDIMLPGMNGMDVCRRIRQTDRHTPILILSAKSEEIDKVVGLETGADDYLTKPFSVREFIARVKVIFRRKEDHAPAQEAAAAPSIIRFAGLEIDTDKRRVTLNEARVDLSPKEFDLI
ncbi:MAG TPA: response regulator transcription factor, partial [Chitinophaga sp.]